MKLQSKKSLLWGLAALVACALLSWLPTTPKTHDIPKLPGELSRYSIGGLQLGMTPEQAAARLGEPQETDDNTHHLAWESPEISALVYSDSKGGRIYCLIGEELWVDGKAALRKGDPEDLALRALSSLGKPALLDIDDTPLRDPESPYRKEYIYSGKLLLRTIDNRVELFMQNY